MTQRIKKQGTFQTTKLFIVIDNRFKCIHDNVYTNRRYETSTYEPDWQINTASDLKPHGHFILLVNKLPLSIVSDTAHFKAKNVEYLYLI